MVQLLFMISLLADIPPLGAARLILVMAPELQEDGMVQLLFTISLLADIPPLGAARLILVMAPELQEDLLGTKVKKVLLVFTYIYPK